MIGATVNSREGFVCYKSVIAVSKHYLEDPCKKARSDSPPLPLKPDLYTCSDERQSSAPPAGQSNIYLNTKKRTESSFQVDWK